MEKMRKWLLSMLVQRLRTLIEVEPVGFHRKLYIDFLNVVQENWGAKRKS